MLPSRLPPGWRRQWLLTALVLALFLSTENNNRNKDHVSSNWWDQRGLQHNSASLSSSFISSTPQCGGELELL